MVKDIGIKKYLWNKLNLQLKYKHLQILILNTNIIKCKKRT